MPSGTFIALTTFAQPLLKPPGVRESTAGIILVVNVVAGVAVGAVLGLASCTSSGSAPHDSSTRPAASAEQPGSSPAASDDSTALLIGAANLPLTGLQLTSSQRDANSISGHYTNADHSDVVVDTVVLFPIAASAQSALPSIEAAAAAQFDSAQERAVSGGKVYRGASGTATLIVAVFIEGRAIVTLAIRSATAQPVSDAAVDSVVTSQSQLIKTNVH